MMDSIITRYMSFPKFVSFLKDGLFIPNGKGFADRWEGKLLIKKLVTDEGKQEYLEDYELLAPWIYISCWHKEECENYAMWKIYGQIDEAVAIETTEEKLRQAYLTNYDDTLAYMDEVNYVWMEYPDTLTLPKAVKRIKNAPSEIRGGEIFPYLLFFFMKDMGYQFEKEIRLVALDKEFRRDIYNSKKGIYVDYKTVNSFIQRIRLSPTAPEWFDGIVSDLVKKYGIDAKIEHSRFFEQPPGIFEKRKNNK
jgi:hypothetical protein